MSDVTTTPAATFVNALISEATKLWTLRSTGYGLLATLAASLGLAALSGSSGGRDYHALSRADQQAFDPTAVGLRGYLVAQLVVGALGLLVITSEYATGTIHTSLTAVPRRRRLLGAKATVLAAAALFIGEVAGFAAFFLAQAIFASHNAPHAALGQPGVLRAVIGSGLYLTAVGLLGVAVGTLLRSTAGGLTVIVAVTLLIPATLPALPEPWERYLQRLWPPGAGSQIMTVHHDPSQLSPWSGFAVLAACVVAVLLAAFAMFHQRDA